MLIWPWSLVSGLWSLVSPREGLAILARADLPARSTDRRNRGKCCDAAPDPKYAAPDPEYVAVGPVIVNGEWGAAPLVWRAEVQDGWGELDDGMKNLSFA